MKTANVRECIKSKQSLNNSKQTSYNSKDQESSSYVKLNFLLVPSFLNGADMRLRKSDPFKKILIASILIFLFILLAKSAWAEVDMSAISMIESSGGKHLIGDSGHAHGQYQTSDIMLKEFAQMTGGNPKDYDAAAHWYIQKRIPQMLKHYGLPVTTKNIIHAYNAGIGNVVKGRVPKVTQSYFKKYEILTGEVLA